MEYSVSVVGVLIHLFFLAAHFYYQVKYLPESLVLQVLETSNGMGYFQLSIPVAVAVDSSLAFFAALSVVFLLWPVRSCLERVKALFWLLPLLCSLAHLYYSYYVFSETDQVMTWTYFVYHAATWLMLITREAGTTVGRLLPYQVVPTIVGCDISAVCPAEHPEPCQETTCVAHMA